MSRRTVAAKRGSVRGAPPDVYVPFGTYGMDGLEERIRDVVRFFGFFFKGLFLVVIIFCAIALVTILSEPPYEDI